MPHVDGVEHQDLVVGGIRRHLATTGPADGPVVLLGHGWPQHWYQWRHLMPALAEAGHRVIVADMRGFGWSEHPPDEDFSHGALVDDVIGLCDVLRLERIAYVGHDWGAWVGFLLALRRPDLLERAVIMSSPDPWPPAPEASAEAVLRLLRFTYQIPLAAPSPPGPLKPKLFQLIAQAGNGKGFSPEEIEVYLAPLRQPSQVRATTLLYRNTLLHELMPIARGLYEGRRLTIPVRYLVGERDAIIDEPAVRALPHRGDAIDTEIVPGVGHFLPEEAAELVADRVLSFLA
jgi:pimeloyl-ACP methyl ester carboxylesterase